MDDGYWARFFGIETADRARSGTSFVRHVQLGDYRGLWCFRRAQRVVVSAPTGWVDVLESRWAGWEPARLLQPAAVAQSLGDACDRCIGPAFHGSVDGSRLRGTVSTTVRAVEAADAAALDGFRARCGEDDWSTSGVGEAQHLRHGAFEGELTALAALRRRSDAWDVCVLTDPHHRGAGRGAEVVRAAVRAALTQGHHVQYQTLESNLPAVRLAEAVSFARSGTHLAARLRHDQPPE